MTGPRRAQMRSPSATEPPVSLCQMIEFIVAALAAAALFVAYRHYQLDKRADRRSAGPDLEAVFQRATPTVDGGVAVEWMMRNHGGAPANNVPVRAELAGSPVGTTASIGRLARGEVAFFSLSFPAEVVGRLGGPDNLDPDGLTLKTGEHTARRG